MASVTSPGKSIVLLAIGSFNPITCMHLRLFELARDHLHASGKGSVVAGVISPVSDKYCKKGLISSAHRVEMCTLAASHAGWLRVDDWESRQPSWVRTAELLTSARRRMERGEHPYSVVGVDPANIKIMLVCGADLLRSFLVPGLWSLDHIETILRDFGMVVISRHGSAAESDIAKMELLSRYKDSILLVDEPVQNDISSTLVRRALARGESVRYLCPDSVIDYISRHNLYSA